jgi:uncharacterized pyridoxamine 5'-phosphate oxidase family protein
MEQTTISQSTLDFLKHPDNLTAVIATCVDGQPHAATVYYAIKDDFTVYFLTAADTQKYQNLLTNQHAAMVVGFGPSHITLQGSGNTTLLEKGSDEELFAISFIKSRLAKTNTTWPIFQLSAADDDPITVFKIDLTELYLLNVEQDNGISTTPDHPEKII